MSEDDLPISPLELAELHRLRVGKPASYAQPTNSYQNSEQFIKFQADWDEAKRKKSKKSEDRTSANLLDIRRKR